MLLSDESHSTKIGSSLEKQVGVTVGKKALKVGYKRYGIPGAIVTGSAATLGYVVIRRALKSTTGKENVESAINIKELQTQVREKGLGTIPNRETLESAINENELGTNVEIEDVQSEAEEETDKLDEDIPNKMEKVKTLHPLPQMQARQLVRLPKKPMTRRRQRNQLRQQDPLKTMMFAPERTMRIKTSREEPY